MVRMTIGSGAMTSGTTANDVASVFVHFGEKTTQTWLLVRLPSPEIPPAR
jgi:hypothetical protein